MKYIALIVVPLLLGVLVAVRDQGFSIGGLAVAAICGGIGALGAVYLVARKKSGGQ